MKHTLYIIYQSATDVLTNEVDTVATTGQMAIESDQALAASGTPLVMNAGFVPAKVKSFFMKSDVNCSVVFKNAAGTTVGTIALEANVPYFFMGGFSVSTMLTSAITDTVATLSVTNTSSPLAAGTLKIRILTDPS